MHIEVVAPKDSPPKDKGDLFEHLAADFLRTQGFDIETQLRVTAAELDLLCKHKVSGKLLYVECKAERDPLSAVPIRTLLGTIHIKTYDEGWLVSAGPLGKDAKGLKVEWEHRKAQDRRQLLIYDPDRVLTALIDANIIKQPPLATGRTHRIGDPVLLVAKAGRFWLFPILSAGVPQSAQLFDASSGLRVTDPHVLTALADTDYSWRTLPIESEPISENTLTADPPEQSRSIVQVVHAETWADYRPARPTDFVGRQQAQNDLLTFLEDVRRGHTCTRVFAITGDTGIGKSSLVAKLRDRLRNRRHSSKFSVLAVDMRAARGPEYVLSSFLHALRFSADSGIGRVHPDPVFQITDAIDPFASAGIASYLETVKQRGQTICLILDQFEELYSKADLYPVFEESQRLLLSCAAAGAPVAIGFVFRSDSLVQQSHPAYYLWNKLSDYRYELRLRQFSNPEIATAMTRFEKALGHRLRLDLRRKLEENCAGLPWLLKKLCIHVFEQIRDGKSQKDLDNTMDVESLFARDLSSCTPVELQCVRVIARQSPADWYEVSEAFGVDVVRSLQERRLIIRNGDRLNLYWDVFREYVLTKQVPSIPFTYLWSSPSIGAFLSVASRLSRDVPVTSDRLSEVTGLSVKTVGNVLHDLLMFGVGSGTPSAFTLDDQLSGGGETVVLERLRVVLRRHAFTRWLRKWPTGTVLAIDDLIAGLREVKPTAKHSEDTWRVYAERLGPWYVAAGLLEATPKGWVVQDAGTVRIPSKKGSRFRIGSFLGDAPPAKVADALFWLSGHPGQTLEGCKRAGFRNAVRVLDRLELTARDESGRIEATVHVASTTDSEEQVFLAASREESLIEIREWLARYPSATGLQVGAHMAEREGQAWLDSSKQRIGSAVAMWATWIATRRSADHPPPAPGPRVRKAKREKAQAKLFEASQTNLEQDA